MGEDVTERSIKTEEGDFNKTSSKPVMLESVSKKIQLKSRGKVFGVVRENYLRSDIPCRSQLCFEECSHKQESEEDSCKKKKQSLLPDSVTHYLVPDTDVVSKYMEILEMEEITGVIFAQTVVNNIQQSSLRQYRRICNFVR